MSVLCTLTGVCKIDVYNAGRINGSQETGPFCIYSLHIQTEETPLYTYMLYTHFMYIMTCIIIRSILNQQAFNMAIGFSSSDEMR